MGLFDMKKWEYKGLIILTVFLVLCLLLSDTIKNLSLAKVKITSATKGRLEATQSYQGFLAFSDITDIALSLENDESIAITKVLAIPGQYVSKGDKLIEAKIIDYDTMVGELNKTYDEIMQEYLALERNNNGLRLRTIEMEWIAAYDTLMVAEKDVMQAQVNLQLAANLAGVELIDGKLPATVSDNRLVALNQEVQNALEVQAEAQEQYDDANRLGISDSVVEYIIKKRELKASIEEIQDKLVRLELLKKQVTSIEAPHDGYIVEIMAEEGATYTGEMPLFSMNTEGLAPVLRVVVSDDAQGVETGSKVSLSRIDGETMTKQVETTSINNEGKTYFDITLEQDEIIALGGAIRLTETGTEATLSYRASQTTTLIPSYAVRGTEDDRFIFIVQYKTGSLGKSEASVYQQGITVIDESGDYVSVEEDLSQSSIAYMEDRTLANGAHVLIY